MTIEVTHTARALELVNKKNPHAASQDIFLSHQIQVKTRGDFNGKNTSSVTAWHHCDTELSHRRQIKITQKHNIIVNMNPEQINAKHM